MNDDTTRAFDALIGELVARAEAGDDDIHVRCLAAMALLAEGWRYGDPDPPGGGEVISLELYRMAA